MPGPLRRRLSDAGDFFGSAVGTGRLAAAGGLRSPRVHVGRRITFADGTTSVVFRETVRHVPIAHPAVLVVRFRLRLIGAHPLPHAVFRRESALHTPLFAGFPGFRTKLWLADHDTAIYRGIYDWDGVDRAFAYAAPLSRLLRLVSERGSVAYHVVPGVSRQTVLDAATGDADHAVGGATAWWRPVAWVPAPDRPVARSA